MGPDHQVRDLRPRTAPGPAAAFDQASSEYRAPVFRYDATATAWRSSPAWATAPPAGPPAAPRQRGPGRSGITLADRWLGEPPAAPTPLSDDECPTPLRRPDPPRPPDQTGCRHSSRSRSAGRRPSEGSRLRTRPSAGGFVDLITTAPTRATSSHSTPRLMGQHLLLHHQPGLPVQTPASSTSAPARAAAQPPAIEAPVRRSPCLPPATATGLPAVGAASPARRLAAKPECRQGLHPPEHQQCVEGIKHEHKPARTRRKQLDDSLPETSALATLAAMSHRSPHRPLGLRRLRPEEPTSPLGRRTARRPGLAAPTLNADRIASIFTTDGCNRSPEQSLEGPGRRLAGFPGRPRRDRALAGRRVTATLDEAVEPSLPECSDDASSAIPRRRPPQPLSHQHLEFAASPCTVLCRRPAPSPNSAPSRPTCDHDRSKALRRCPLPRRSPGQKRPAPLLLYGAKLII